MKKTIVIAVFPLAFLVVHVCQCSALVIGESFRDSYAYPTNFPTSISGTVRDGSGTPAAGVRVSFHPGHYPLAPYFSETNTDQNGRYNLNIFQNTNEFEGWFGSINPTNFVMAQDSSRNLVVIEEFAIFPTNLDLRLQPGIIFSGVVKDTDGAPVTNAEINLSMLVGHSLPNVEPHPRKTDAHGAFSFPPLPPGREYMIFRVKAPGYGSGFARVEAKNSHTNHFEFPVITLKKADKILAGKVIGRYGQPLAGAEVSFNGIGQPDESHTKSDSRGRFVFDSVCVGAVQLSAYASFGNHLNHDTYASANNSAPIKAQAGDTNILIDFSSVDYPDPLIEAARYNEKDQIASLFADGASIKAVDNEGKTALHWAAASGNDDIASFLITNHADVMARDNRGVTPLHAAVIAGDTAIIKLLLAHGADVNVRANNGFTPLHWAALYGKKDAAEVLLTNKANVNALNNDGRTPLYWAQQNGRKSLAQLLRENGGKEFIYDANSPEVTTNLDMAVIQNAVQSGDTNSVATLIEKNLAVVTAKFEQDRTLLIKAVMSRRADVVQLLIDKKADINAHDIFGRNALHWAALIGASKAAEVLLNNGADIAAKAEGGMTALHYAARNGFTNVVELLVAHGADINATNSTGITPLRATENELQNTNETKAATTHAKIYAAKAQGWKDVTAWLRDHGAQE